MQRPLVGVIIGGRADFNVMRRGLETLRVMGVPYVFEVISPHRNPHKVAEFARTAGERGIEILIAAEGGTALLASQLAAHTNLPIIGVPIDASPLRGQDTLFSLVMLPPGMPVATVGINNSENAAVLAAQILALKHSALRTVLAHRRMSMGQRAEGISKELANEYPDLCLPERTAPLTRSVSDNDTEGGISEAVTPEPGEESERIRPGAIWVERPAGAAVEALVSTPLPQEPGSPQVQTPIPPTLQGLISDPFGRKANGPSSTLPPPSSFRLRTEADTPLPIPNAPTAGVTSLLGRVSATDETPPADTPVPESSSKSGEPRFLEPLVPSAPTKAIPPQPPVAPTPVVIPRDATPLPTAALRTKIFKVERESPSEDLVDHAMMVLLEGGVLALPTDTVYGLAADGTNPAAVERLFHIRGKEHQKTLGVLIHHPDMLDRLVAEVPPALESVIEKCWPGALTIVFPKNPATFANITRSDRIGVRIPSDKLCLSIIERVGRPIVMRNASLANNEPLTEATAVIEQFNGHVDCILDGGNCTSNGASTVLSAVGEQFEILREGGVPRKKLKDLLGSRLKD